jgi:hypothetical protein
MLAVRRRRRGTQGLHVLPRRLWPSLRGLGALLLQLHSQSQPNFSNGNVRKTAPQKWSLC